MWHRLVPNGTSRGESMSALSEWDKGILQLILEMLEAREEEKA